MLFPFSTSAQSIDLIVFEPLPEVDFAAFAFADIPAGNTRIFQIVITPAGERVVLEGSIEWKKNANSSFENLFSFRTHPFIARNITNQDLGRADIRMANSDSNNDLAEENLRKGKPSGEYKISLTLKDPNGRTLGNDSEVLSFLNPTQTISIRTPEANSNQDVGSTILQWDGVVGATRYEVLANVRSNESQSLEEAIQSGTPLINRAEVGSRTIVNMRELYTREPLAGQEIVVQVVAVVDGPGGGEELFSDIINFYLSSSDSPEMEAMRMRMVNIFSALGGGGSIRDFLDMLSNGEIDISSLRVVDEAGRSITVEELQQVLVYLQTNPGSLIDVNFMEQ